MKNTSPSHPLITIDFKKHRIRIHKNTLHALNDPEYVLLLVNPEARRIAVQISDRSDVRAHRLSLSASVRNASFDIYSASLLEKLTLCSEWKPGRKYRIYGSKVEGESIVQFKIADSFVYM